MNLVLDADLVCSRAKTHFDPNEYLDNSTVLSGSTSLEAFKDGYMPLHENQQTAMYFAVRSLDFHRNGLLDLTVFSIVTPDNRHTAQSTSDFFDEL